MNRDLSDERLNALVDGELAPAETAALLECLAGDAALRERVAQLRLTKELVRHAYADGPPAQAAAPGAPRERGRRTALAAALFGAGLLLGGLARELVIEPRSAAPQTADLGSAAAESASSCCTWARPPRARRWRPWSARRA